MSRNITSRSRCWTQQQEHWPTFPIRERFIARIRRSTPVSLSAATAATSMPAWPRSLMQMAMAKTMWEAVLRSTVSPTERSLRSASFICRPRSSRQGGRRACQREPIATRVCRTRRLSSRLEALATKSCWLPRISLTMSFSSTLQLARSRNGSISPKATPCPRPTPLLSPFSVMASGRLLHCGTHRRSLSLI